MNAKFKSWLETEGAALISYGFATLVFGIIGYQLSEGGNGWGNFREFSPFAAFGLAVITFVTFLVFGEALPNQLRAVVALWALGRAALFRKANRR